MSPTDLHVDTQTMLGLHPVDQPLQDFGQVVHVQHGGTEIVRQAAGFLDGLLQHLIDFVDVGSQSVVPGPAFAPDSDGTWPRQSAAAGPRAGSPRSAAAPAPPPGTVPASASEVAWPDAASSAVRWATLLSSVAFNSRRASSACLRSVMSRATETYPVTSPLGLRTAIFVDSSHIGVPSFL